MRPVQESATESAQASMYLLQHTVTTDTMLHRAATNTMQVVQVGCFVGLLYCSTVPGVLPNELGGLSIARTYIQHNAAHKQNMHNAAHKLDTQCSTATHVVLACCATLQGGLCCISSTGAKRVCF